MKNNIQLTSNVRGIVTAKRVSSDKVVTSKVVSDNLVVDNGMALIGTPARDPETNKLQPLQLLGVLKVSGDKTEVTKQDTDIGTVIASQPVSLLSRESRFNFVTNQGVGTDENGDYLYSRNVWVFEEGSITEAVSKIGVYALKYNPDDTESQEPVEMGLYAACLLQDDDGSPASILPFEDETFEVTYESRWYIPSYTAPPEDVDLNAAGVVPITITSAGIPHGLDQRMVTTLLASTTNQFSSLIIKDNDRTLDFPYLVRFSPVPVKSATEVYTEADFLDYQTASNYTVTETSGPDHLEISVHVNKNQFWPRPVQSAVIYSSRGIFYVGFGKPIHKLEGSRRTVVLNFTFGFGRLD